MKQTIFTLTILTLFWGCKTQSTDNGHSTYKGLPFIKAKSTQATTG